MRLTSKSSESAAFQSYEFYPAAQFQVSRWHRRQMCALLLEVESSPTFPYTVRGTVHLIRGRSMVLSSFGGITFTDNFTTLNFFLLGTGPKSDEMSMHLLERGENV